MYEKFEGVKGEKKIALNSINLKTEQKPFRNPFFSKKSCKAKQQQKTAKTIVQLFFCENSAKKVVFQHDYRIRI